jgi:hypothetical protein
VNSAVQSLAINETAPEDSDISAIAPGIQIVLDYRTHGDVCVSVSSKADVLDRVVLKAIGQDIWECQSCAVSLKCRHVAAWTEYSGTLEAHDIVPFEKDWCTPNAILESDER